VYANPRKPVPLPPGSIPVSLKIPRDGRLVEWAPAPARKPAPMPQQEAI
jgi:hypothetical protein